MERSRREVLAGLTGIIALSGCIGGDGNERDSAREDVTVPEAENGNGENGGDGENGGTGDDENGDEDGEEDSDQEEEDEQEGEEEEEEEPTEPGTVDFYYNAQEEQLEITNDGRTFERSQIDIEIQNGSGTVNEDNISGERWDEGETLIIENIREHQRVRLREADDGRLLEEWVAEVPEALLEFEYDAGSSQMIVRHNGGEPFHYEFLEFRSTEEPEPVVIGSSAVDRDLLMPGAEVYVDDVYDRDEFFEVYWQTPFRFEIMDRVLIGDQT